MKGLIIGGAVVLVLGIILISFIGGYVSYRNGAENFEADIPAQYEQMKNVYDNGWKQVMEQNQLSDKYAEQFKDAFQAILRGDSNGQQAMIQVLTAMPNYDSSITKKVMESVETFHGTFSATQTKIISEKQEYRKYTHATTASIMYNWLAGYPRIKCGPTCGASGADDYAILTSDKTDTDFKKHKADALDLSKK